MSYTDKNGKTIDGGYGIKVGDDYYAATKEKDGSYTINSTSYTDKDGNTKTALNQLGAQTVKLKLFLSTVKPTMPAKPLVTTSKHSLIWRKRLLQPPKPAAEN
ncbi:flagellin [Salmonella enterica subsp. enterica]|uniref:Flagellin n=1 Tax=Salmonella enterica I TaxID=59201 RepID=A0A379W8J5_SALET|nr:flagellin [Salmonella enterica subsp. enterica]